MTVNADGTYAKSSGVASETGLGCQLHTFIGQTIYIPIFVGFDGGNYRMSGIAAWYLTGVNMSGSTNDESTSIATNRRICSGSAVCLYGWFTSGLLPSSTFIPGGGGGGQARGALGIGLIG